MKCVSLVLLCSLCFTTPTLGGMQGHDDSGQVGVLLASHGDIESLGQLRSYMKKAMMHMAPLPPFLSAILFEFSWPAMKEKYVRIYESFGVNTGYLGNSEAQAEAIASALHDVGLHVKVYVGFNLLSPTVAEAMDEMRRDNVQTIVVINQGAQFSMATEMNYGDITEYLKRHSDYQPHVIGVNEYSTDPRFRQVLQDEITNDIDAFFPNSSQSVCVLSAFHGLPVAQVQKGDMATHEMIWLYDDLAERMPEQTWYYGFLNEDVVPFIPWTTPTAAEAGRTIGDSDCDNVLLDARVSFTVHPRVALYDLNVVARAEIMERNPYAVVVLADNFNDSVPLAAFLADVVMEALDGEGDLSHLSADSGGGHSHGGGPAMGGQHQIDCAACHMTGGGH